MNEKQEYKHVREVFRDFSSSNQHIMEAKVKAINLFKKTNTLEITLLSNTLIEVKGVYAFEKYLEVRFGIANIQIKIENENIEQSVTDNACETTEIDKIGSKVEKEWEDIIEYMAYKHPMFKAILAKSNIGVDNKNINVLLSKKGKEFLTVKKFDEILSSIIFNIYGARYKVICTENINEDDIKKYQEYNKKMQEEAIRNLQIESNISTEEQEEYSNMPPPPPPENIPFDDSYFGEVPPPPPTEEDYLLELEELEEEKNYILGKPSKAKENKVKIKEISAENKRITIEGRVVTCECRETKTGKGMIIFDLYDGTGIITCKSFTTDAKEGNEVAEKIRNASGIKTIGKAGLDAFAGDVTVMSNIIIEINGDNFPKLPTEDEDSPLILGMNPEIKEPLIKVQDVGIESGNVCIDGEVIAMEDRELKGGKILLSLSIYDGTSTMTCKAFLTKDNSKKVIGKIKGAKASYSTLFFP